MNEMEELLVLFHQKVENQNVFGMKRVLYFFSLLLFMGLFSCDNITEEIHINKDGSGEYRIYSDMIPAMVQMGVMFAEMDTTLKDLDPAALEIVVKSKVMEDFPEEVDSVLVVKEEQIEKFKDDPLKYRLAQQMVSYMEGGKSKGYMNMGVRTPFRNTSELNTLNQMIQDESEESPQAGGPGSSSLLDNYDSDITYSYKKNTFSRSTIFKTKGEVDEKEIATASQMLGEAKLRTIVYLPPRVKSIKGDHLVSKDKEKAVFEYNLIDLLQGKVNTDFKIKWKK